MLKLSVSSWFPIRFRSCHAQYWETSAPWWGKYWETKHWIKFWLWIDNCSTVNFGVCKDCLHSFISFYPLLVLVSYCNYKICIKHWLPLKWILSNSRHIVCESPCYESTTSDTATPIKTPTNARHPQHQRIESQRWRVYCELRHIYLFRDMGPQVTTGNKGGRGRWGTNM